MRRTKEDAARTRAGVLRAALAVFSEKGYGSATLEDVARKARVTRGAIYWHFSGKADLYNALIQEHSAPHRAVVEEEVARGGTVAEVLRRIFVRQLALVESDRQLRAMMELALFKTELSDEIQPGRRKRIRAGHALIAELAGAMRAGIREGSLRKDLDPETAARAFLAFQNGVVQLWLSAPRAFSLEQSATGFADVLLRGLTGS